MSPISAPYDLSVYTQPVAPEDVPAKVEQVATALSAHWELIDHVRGLFGDALAESLTRSLTAVEEATNDVASGIQSLQREIQNGAAYAREREAERAELAKVLDVATMQQMRAVANRQARSYGGQEKPDVTLVEAAEFNRDERVRLFDQVQIERANVQAISDEMDRGIMATSMEIDAYHQALLALVREKVITRKQCNQIQRDAEAAYRDAT